jgi:hypothetical protein
MIMKSWVLGLSGALMLGMAVPASAITVSSGGVTAVFDLSSCDTCSVAQDDSKLGITITLPGTEISPLIDITVTDGGAPPVPVPITSIFFSIGGTGGTASFLDVFNSSVALAIPDPTTGLMDYTSSPLVDGIDQIQGDITAGVTTVTIDLNSVPEPVSIAMLAVGLIGLVGARARRTVPA